MLKIDDRELATYLERNVVVLMKDDSYLYGTFKSYDQYNSITLNYVVERIFYGGSYGERRQGLMVVRGESIVFIGLANMKTGGLRRVEYEEVARMKGERIGGDKEIKREKRER